MEENNDGSQRIRAMPRILLFDNLIEIWKS